MMTNLESMIPANNECRVIDVFCDKLDMVSMGFEHTETKTEGRPPYDPSPLLKLYLYGLLNRICSSRKLSIEATRNIEVMQLINGMHPSKRMLCYFKEHNKEQIREAFLEFNKFYRKIGFFGKETVALDSVKVKANNSKKRHHNKETVNKTLKKTQERIDEYLAALDEADKNDGFNEERDLMSEQIKKILAKPNAKRKSLKISTMSLKNAEKNRFPRLIPMQGV